MVEQWGMQLLHGVGRMFLNPLLYWVLILLFIAGARRVKEERKHFGVKINNYFKEIRRTFWFSFLFGVMISIISLSFGFVWTIEFVYLFAIITIILSITGSFHLLSPAYTLGFTFFLYMLIPILPLDSVPFLSTFPLFANREWTMFVGLVALLMFIEAFLLMQTKESDLFSRVSLSERGVWLGEQQIKRLLVLPFFLFIPTQEVTGLEPLIPYFQIGNASFYVTVVPLILGSQLTTVAAPMMTFKKEVIRQKLILATIVLAFAIASYFYPVFVLIAMVFAIIGTEWITYRSRLRNRYGTPFFAPQKRGIRVLTTLPGSRAEELEIVPGEVITKVNGIEVTNSQEFYEALQQSGAFFKLEVLDHNDEVRFIQSAFFAKDHHELGLIFPEAPYNKRVTNLLDEFVEGN